MFCDWCICDHSCDFSIFPLENQLIQHQYRTLFHVNIVQRSKKNYENSKRKKKLNHVYVISYCEEYFLGGFHSPNQRWPTKK